MGSVATATYVRQRRVLALKIHDADLQEPSVNRGPDQHGEIVIEADPSRGVLDGVTDVFFADVTSRPVGRSAFGQHTLSGPLRSAPRSNAEAELRSVRRLRGHSSPGRSSWTPPEVGRRRLPHPPGRTRRRRPQRHPRHHEVRPPVLDLGRLRRGRQRLGPGRKRLSWAYDESVGEILLTRAPIYMWLREEADKVPTESRRVLDWSQAGLPVAGQEAAPRQGLASNTRSCVSGMRKTLSPTVGPSSHGPISHGVEISGALPIGNGETMTSCMDPATNLGVDFASLGYIEEEFLVSGVADVDDGAGNLRVASKPFTTRVVVRRPEESSKFSGTVHLEPFHAAAEGDPSWFFFNEQWVRNGDAWLGVTVHPGTFGPLVGWPSGVLLLRELDAARYGELNLFASDPPQTTALDLSDMSRLRALISQAYPQGPEIVTQLGSLLKTDSPASLFGGGQVARVYASGCSQTGVFWAQFIDHGHADRARLSDGRPVFDAYFIGVATAPMNKPADSVLVVVLSESEVTGAMPFERIGQSPEDSDQPRFRAFEVPGSWHGWLNFGDFTNANTPWWGQLVARGYPGVSSLTGLQVGASHDQEGVPVTHTDRPFHLVSNALWAGLDHWVRSGEPMLRAPRVDRNPDLARDEVGNLTGGLRLPWIEVPTARYAGSCSCSPGVGRMWKIEEAELHRRYPGPEELRERFTAAVARAVRIGYLLDEDADRAASVY